MRVCVCVCVFSCVCVCVLACIRDSERAYFSHEHKHTETHIVFVRFACVHTFCHQHSPPCTRCLHTTHTPIQFLSRTHTPMNTLLAWDLRVHVYTDSPRDPVMMWCLGLCVRACVCVSGVRVCRCVYVCLFVVVCVCVCV